MTMMKLLRGLKVLLSSIVFAGGASLVIGIVFSAMKLHTGESINMMCSGIVLAVVSMLILFVVDCEIDKKEMEEYRCQK